MGITSKNGFSPKPKKKIRDEVIITLIGIGHTHLTHSFLYPQRTSPQYAMRVRIASRWTTYRHEMSKIRRSTDGFP